MFYMNSLLREREERYKQRWGETNVLFFFWGGGGSANMILITAAKKEKKKAHTEIIITLVMHRTVALFLSKWHTFIFGAMTGDVTQLLTYPRSYFMSFCGSVTD